MAQRDEFGNLVGYHKAKVGTDAYLTFQFPKLGMLKVRSGANSINWSYELNTVSVPTIGGEVIQILSCFVGPLTIQGMAAGYPTTENPKGNLKLTTPLGWGNETTPADEMTEIIEWFLAYMHEAGAEPYKRDERAIKFEYPKRGWSFFIQPTQLDGFALNKEAVAVPWSITAEVVSDNDLDFMIATTMNTFTDSLTQRNSLHHTITPGWEFLNNPFINPALEGNLLNAAIIGNMADNFQGLIAAWASGDFEHWGFSHIMSGAENNFKDDPYDVYGDLFGYGDGKSGRYLGVPPLNDYGRNSSYRGPQGGGGGNDDLPGGGDLPPIDGSKQSVACRLAAAMEDRGIPARIAVAAALHESGLSPEARNCNDGGTGVDSVGILQTHALGAGGNTPTLEAALNSASKTHSCNNDGKGSKVTPYYTAEQQIDDAVIWWARTARNENMDFEGATDAELAEFARLAQNPGADSSYSNAVQRQLSEADRLIKQCFTLRDGPCPGPVFVGGTALGNMYKTHDTTGIPQYEAVDVFARVGTTVIAPENLKVTRTNSTSTPGHAFYATGLETGMLYWFGHLNEFGRPALGAAVARGKPIGTLFNMADPHVHVGVNASPVGFEWLGCEGYVTGGCGHPTLCAQYSGNRGEPEVKVSLCGYSCPLTYETRKTDATPGLKAVQSWLRSKGGNPGDPAIDYPNHVLHSHHWCGMALDIGDAGNPSSLIKTWNLLWKYRGSLRQLIWAPTSSTVKAQAPGSGGGYDCGIGPWHDADDTHDNHIHVAFTGTAEQWANIVS